MKPENIREFVWKVIDTDISLKKDIGRGVINIRSLAKYIIVEFKLKVSIDSVISAIRRYPKEKKKSNTSEVYSILKEAKIRTMTKMATISLKKNEKTTEALSKVLPKINFEVGETLRVLEGAKLFKIIVDNKTYEKMFDFFSKNDILEKSKDIGIVEISYPDKLKKMPGVFSAVATELGANDVSIIDALIISNEHIISVKDKDITKAFDILYNLCN